MKHESIKARPVSVEAFAPYGTLVPLIPASSPDDDSANLSAWVGVVRFSPGEGRDEILLRLKRRPMVLTVLERHVRTAEWWTNVDGEMVAAFAEAVNPDDPDEKPDPSRIVAFRLKGVAGYLVNRGVWHWPAFPVGDAATQFVNLRHGTPEEDIEKVDLPYPVRIEP